MTLPKVHLHIGDQKLTAGSGGTHTHIFAANGKSQGEVPLAGVSEINAAVEAASKAFAIWRRWKPAARRDVLIRLAQLIDRHSADFSRLATFDNGTPASFAPANPTYAKEWFAYYAGWADKLDGQVTSTFSQQGEFSYTLSEPYGVIGIILTWNGPLPSLGMKVAPALAAGNTVVVKPSELTPFAPELFMRLVGEAGIPPGVINMVPGGIEAGQALVEHPRIEKISFTGGPVTARKILAACAPLMKPAVLELGGKSANLVFPDANLDFTAQHATMFSIKAFSGQACAWATRLIVHDSVYDELVKKVVQLAQAIRVGDPWDPQTESGPVINEASAIRIMAMIDRANSVHAGRLMCGGARPGGALSNGAYVEPTVFADVDPQSEIGQQEVFGPVLSIMRFSSEDEAIAIANATDYGLAGYIHTHDVSRVHRLAEQMKAGGIFVNGGSVLAPNTPFGGHGLSGYGREGGRQGLEEFVRPKTVAIA